MPKTKHDISAIYMIDFQTFVFANAVMYLVMLIVCMWFDKGIVILPTYLSIHKILHLLDQRIVLVFQHSLLVVYL